MSFKAKVILDSISTSGKRLITMELTYPRFIHAEFMTHRMFSRNAASSRAIPTRKMIEMVEENPAVPIYWGKNRRGMSASKEIDERSIELAKDEWMLAREECIKRAKALYELGIHKQIVNRILEPWKFITVICTATEWSNFFALRRHKDAQPEIHHLADLMWEAQEKSIPSERLWHMPYLREEDYAEFDTEDKWTNLPKISTARCARVSYLTHSGIRSTDKDLELFDRLKTGSGKGHWSPFEHVAKASDNPNERSGNFIGWVQYRKMFEGECQ